MNRSHSLRSDTKGAILLLGLFMAVFLVGLLYHVISLGQSITYKEKLQDVADTSAFSAGASYARSMNLIGLMNFTQLTGVSVVLALAWIDSELENCTRNNETTKFTYPYKLCFELEPKLHPAYERAQAHWTPLFSAITAASEAIRDATPRLAQNEVNTVGLMAMPAVQTAGLVATPPPLVRAKLEVLCAKAFMFVTPLARNAGLGPLIDVFSMPDEVVARYLSSSHCPSVASAGPLVMEPPNQSGTEALQVRAFAVGNSDILPWSNEGVRLPLQTIARGSDSTREWIHDRDDYLKLGTFGLAQAEYYSNWALANLLDDDIPTNIPEENTFYMHWKARLRRLRVPIHVTTNIHQADIAFRRWVETALRPACTAHCTTTSCANQCLSLSTLGSLGNTSLH